MVQVRMYVDKLNPVIGQMWEAIAEEYLKEYTYLA
jgi:hypothetical protein